MGDTGLEPVTSALSSSLALGPQWLHTAAHSQIWSQARRALCRSVPPRLRAMLGIFPAIPKIDSVCPRCPCCGLAHAGLALDSGERAVRHQELLRLVAGVADREGDEQLGDAPLA